MSERDLLKGLLDEFLAFIAPVTVAATNPLRRAQLFRSLGWNLGAIEGFDLAKAEAWLAQVAEAAEGLKQIIDGGVPDSLEELEGQFNSARALGQVLSGLPPELNVKLASLPELAALPGLLAEDLLTLLTTNYLRARAPVGYEVAVVLGFITPAEESPPSTPIPQSGIPIRLARRRSRMHWERIGEFIRNPQVYLKGLYAPEAADAQARADATADLLFPRLAALLRAMGIGAHYGLLPSEGPPLGAVGQAIASHMLTLSWAPPWGSGNEGLDVTLALSPPGRGGLGLVVIPRAIRPVDRHLGRWHLGTEVTPGIAAFSVSEKGFRRLEGTGGVKLAGTLERLPDADGLAWVLGPPTGTRVEVGQLRLAAHASLGTGSPGTDDFGLKLEASKVALVIHPGADGDGFLQKVLPPEGLRTTFDVAVGWSKRGGLSLGGSAGLEANLAIGKELLGVLRVDTLHLALRAAESGLRAEVAATVSVKLGPLTAAVERVGLEANVTFPPKGGNLGPADLALKFKPPSGAALAIDAGVVVGGGYLKFDPEKEQYAGAVQLEIVKQLSLTAFGLLTTRMPDGSKGFSLLVLIAVEFSPPIQLGYGFTLNGVGGLLGINRTVAVDKLRSGLRTGAIGSILFPKDPIRNAPQIVSDLQAIFPPAKGRYLFGPMAKLGWGTPTLVSLELGLLLELPAPVRLFILSRLSVVLPEESVAVVRLQLDALGVIDFDTGDVSLDAVLYDSRVAQFAVTGEMALRANFGANPGFILAVGGFNPRFQAPPAFPSLERVAISLATGNNPRLRLEAYLALTTNTVQFGARLDLYAEAGPFSVTGLLGFDALVQFDPFGFVVDIGADIALKYNGKSLMSVGLQMTLTGPSPWHAVGRAHFKLLFIKGSINFDVRFGRQEPPPLPAPVEVRPLLLAALREPGNWVTQLPRSEHPLVSLREQAPTEYMLVHPLADLQVNQRVVPLGLEIARFGNATPAGERQFTLGVVGADGRLRTRPEEGVEPVSDHFAPGQFRTMSDDEKLTAPAFERLQSGIRFAERGFKCGTAVVETEIQYEEASEVGAAVATPAPTPALRTAVAAPVQKPATYSVSTAFLKQVAQVGAAALSAMGQTGPEKYRLQGPARGFRLKPPTFIARSAGGVEGSPSAGSTDVSHQSYAEAAVARQRRLVEHPEERSLLKVVATYVTNQSKLGGGR